MNNIGCLIIHGFAGNRKEVDPLVTYLKENDYIVAIPLLAGHESSRRALSKSNYLDWIQSASIEFENLKKKCNKIIVIGFSMGGLIAVNLYQKYQIDGIVFINTPIYYWAIKRIILNLYHDFVFFFKKYFVASTNKAFFAMMQFLILLYKTKPLFGQILCPTLIIQTMDDDTVNPRSAEFIYKQVKGGKHIVKYPTGGHILFHQDPIDDILKEIALFCSKISVL